MTRSLYLECSAGISGDMTVAALLDAGASEEKLRSVLDTLPVQGFSIEISRVQKAGQDACDFNVVLDEVHENHDHDMEYLYGQAHEHEHSREHHCEHRGMAEITAIIDGCAATEGAKDLAKRIFNIIANAEAKAHETTVDQVHFHEVGAVDSIVDVLAAAVCFDDLGISDVIVTRLNEGQGTVRCQHGVLPVPVPAVCNIVEAHQIPLKILNVQGELVTPTGAAIAAALRTTDKLPKMFTVERIGLGAGKRVYPETSGLLRALIINDRFEN